jgi:RimJ/RimL family protein N-acetyltransferase
MKYFKKIVGKRVYLSPMNSEDYLKYVEWMNSDVVAKNIGNFTSIISIDFEKGWLEKATSEKYIFAIIDKENDTLIGNISLTDIHEVNRTAVLGIFIGDDNYHSKGYGSEAIMLLLDYGFNYINLNNIMLKVFAPNKRAIKAYEKCGFKTFGIWKESRYFNGEYSDEIYMNITKKEYNNK